MGGLQGEAEEWVTAEGQYRRYMDLGVMKMAMAFDGRRAWQDQNGQIRELQGVDRARIVTAAYLASFSHLLPDRMAGRMEYLGEETDEQGKYHVLAILPADGLEMKCYLDRQTYLPARLKYPKGEMLKEVVFEDYRQVQGLQRPFKITWLSAVDPRSDAHETVKSVELNAPVDEACFAMPEAAPADYRFASGSQAAIPFELQGGLIRLAVQVDGKGPLAFLFDTGATMSVIDANKAQELGLPLQGEVAAAGATGQATGAALLKVSTLKLDGVELLDQTLVAVDLAPIREASEECDGVLGCDLLSRFVVAVDYARSLLHLYPTPGYQYSGTGVVLPLEIEHHWPHIRARLNGRYEGKFLIDTGFGKAVLLNRSFVEESKILNVVEKTIAYPLVGLGGEQESPIGRLQSLRLGDQIEIEAPLARFHTQDLPVGRGAGIIGTEVLRRFTVIFNYAQHQLILEPNEAFEEPFTFDMSGLLLKPEEDRFKIHKVLEGSPAEEAGLQVGDELVMVDDQPSSRYSLEELDRMFEQEVGRIYRLRIRRGDREWEVELKLRPLI
jgi:predicted aspartyl protease